MTVKTIIQEYIDKLVNLGYRVTADAEGNIRVTDDKHGVINLRVINIGNEVRFDFSKNVNASDDFENAVIEIFTNALNR